MPDFNEIKKLRIKDCGKTSCFSFPLRRPAMVRCPPVKTLVRKLLKTIWWKYLYYFYIFYHISGDSNYGQKTLYNFMMPACENIGNDNNAFVCDNYFMTHKLGKIALGKETFKKFTCLKTKVSYAEKQIRLL